MFREVSLILPIVSVSLRFVIIQRQSFTHRAVADMLPTALYSSSFGLPARFAYGVIYAAAVQEPAAFPQAEVYSV
ncbi:hypothetical protein ACQFN5_22605 [Klebsiella sp. WOUb02]|uniref:hypothetical protein n=1 Tax=Klebsiella sp. WOUb02 TaxID=3161071 RepID=UPI003CEF7976